MENMQNTPNRKAFNAGAGENKNFLITTFKSSPKSPASKIEKKKSFKKKGSKKALRQRNRRDSQSSELPNSSRQKTHQPDSASSYNLIEFYGDRSRSVSAQENIANSFSAATSSARAITSGSDNLNDLQVFSERSGRFNPAGISVRRTLAKVIFLVPERWASSVEIMRLPVPSDLNSLENSPVSSVSTYEQHANSVGPIRYKAKTRRHNRNTPYSTRRDKQSHCATASGNESTTRTAGRDNPKSQNIPESVESNEYCSDNNGYKYEPRGNQRISSSIGPIRWSNKRKAFYTPYGDSARGRANYNSMDSASISPSDSFNRADSHSYCSGRNNYKYSDKSNWSIMCWHCRKRGHIRINCPWR